MTLAHPAAASGFCASAPLSLQPLHSEQVHGFGPWKDFVHDNFPWLEHRDDSGRAFHAEVGAVGARREQRR